VQQESVGRRHPALREEAHGGRLKACRALGVRGAESPCRASPAEDGGPERVTGTVVRVHARAKRVEKEIGEINAQAQSRPQDHPGGLQSLKHTEHLGRYADGPGGVTHMADFPVRARGRGARIQGKQERVPDMRRN
jgi:hypothetical protein